MSYNINKRIIYVWPENKEFYDQLTNKSDVVNRYLLELREKEQNGPQTSILDKLREIDERAATQG